MPIRSLRRYWSLRLDDPENPFTATRRQFIIISGIVVALPTFPAFGVSYRSASTESRRFWKP
jgi:hypothetical protein